MVPLGFKLAVAEAAIKKPGRTDMALIFSETDASAAAAFTTNKLKGGAVSLGMRRIRSGAARAVVINSGNSNSGTGPQGLRDAEDTAALAARALEVPESRVFVSSTGVIGVPLPMDRIGRGVDMLASRLGSASLEDLARAIMTTDSFPKLITRTLTIGSRKGSIAAVAKGAGMIAPNMATLLCFIMTDIAVESSALKAALKDSVERSFNRITVDGDRSTCDTAMALSSGALGNKPLTTRSRGYGAFHVALREMLHELSRMIVRDGEGATKVIEVRVSGARTEAEAKKGAFSVANSLLVKTAVFGGDPNWGRIIAALGYAGIAFKETATTIGISGVTLFDRGRVTGRVKEALEALKGKEVTIDADLGQGRALACVLTCDLTYDYVRINAEYTT